VSASDRSPMTDQLVPLPDISRTYELTRGLVLADIRFDENREEGKQALNTIMVELDIPDEHVWTVLSIMAHTRTAAAKLCGLDAYRRELEAATVTNLVLKLS
jgi:hypothetical protein